MIPLIPILAGIAVTAIVSAIIPDELEGANTTLTTVDNDEKLLKKKRRKKKQNDA